MARSYFSKGCRGGIVLRLQRALQALGVAPPVLVRFTDGDYGERTARAVATLQEARGLPTTGEVDEATWVAAMHQRLPSLFERSLQLTADFEGHGFTLAQGNFDGAGITWGIIGFTLQGGELAKVLLEIEAREPGTLDAAFGPLAPRLREVLDASRPEQIEWADSISLGPAKATLAPAWRHAFARLGALPVSQEVQVAVAHDQYWTPAVRSAEMLQLHTERGLALCFDTHVQSGGIRPAVMEAAARAMRQSTESDRLPMLARAIANAVTRPEYRADVLARRMCIAGGGGTVHGVTYRLAAWGMSVAAAS